MQFEQFQAKYLGSMDADMAKYVIFSPSFKQGPLKSTQSMLRRFFKLDTFVAIQSNIRLECLYALNGVKIKVVIIICDI